ncbi:MAG: hypothetical protein HC921_22070 [Synechococcaceae cyanobacterium SM2_3_1]|nr:hypothetical protein [Synechococcaceae cyanobacterium SM2_3_1]
MRKFIDIQQELELKEFLNSVPGTLYCSPSAPMSLKMMVRYFDNDFLITLVKPFADIVRAIQQWIEQRPELARLVTVEQPIEVGYDFIARRFHIYGTSTRSYLDWDNPPKPPEELEQMRTIFRREIGNSTNPKNILIETVLAKSLLEPTSKTYFARSKGQFIVIEPKITCEDIKQWNTLSQISEE